ncbi:uncharacterized protein LOC127653445 isoform X3 [Xyrauchen texanus]|uniref:uncharacterized protein LOC127653445 isoform X2 n=1 Tax=Xyrauchen texanus TaxID=154827 RepID=UPI002241A1D8|nr:uncharacterized protein LOC127653445 isoform X2 [Xyrauchen texanus]XP_051996095.1 uncharacterized protein LOC127653445 isoform X3 [Xyrauchen texanus]
MLRYLLPDVRRVKRLCEGCVGSSTMLAALRMQCFFVNVFDGGKRNPDDLLSCPHYPLQGFAVRNGASPKPGSDAVAQDALNSPSIECSEDGGWEMCFPQPSKKVETLLGFLGNRASVEGPGEVLRQVNTKECGALGDLHRGADYCHYGNSGVGFCCSSSSPNPIMKVWKNKLIDPNHLRKHGLRKNFKVIPCRGDP